MVVGGVPDLPVDPTTPVSPSGSGSASWRRTVGRLLHAGFVLALAAFIVLPALPTAWTGTIGSSLADWGRKISVRQTWRMYAPNAQRAHMYMNLRAVYDDGTERELEETEQEQAGWGTHWLWNKTRVDIWRQYANFHPRKRNENRTWYLRGVCVREARRGEIPHRIVMQQVRRRLTPPEKVLAGAPGLGRPHRQLVTVQYCKTQRVLEMIEQDRARRGQEERPDG